MNPFKGYILNMVLKKAEKICKGLSGRILDLGCGKGDMLKLLKSNPDLKIFGLDISEEQLISAKDSKAALIRGDIFLLPFKDSSIRTVLCFNTIYNFDSLDNFNQGFIEMMRVTESGGRILIDIRNKRNPLLKFKYWWHMKKGGFPTISYIPDDIIKILEKLDCYLEKIEPVGLKFRFLSFGYIMIFRKR